MAPKAKDKAVKGKSIPKENKPIVEPVVKEETVKEPCVCTSAIDEIICQIVARVQELEVKVNEYAELLKRKSVSLQKVEGFNGEEIPPQEDSRMKMTYEEKLLSMTNAAKILPPNMIVEGRHSRENVQALVGFLVDEEMMNEMYSKFKHEDF